MCRTKVAQVRLLNSVRAYGHESGSYLPGKFFGHIHGIKHFPLEPTDVAGHRRQKYGFFAVFLQSASTCKCQSATLHHRSRAQWAFVRSLTCTPPMAGVKIMSDFTVIKVWGPEFFWPTKFSTAHIAVQNSANMWYTRCDATASTLLLITAPDTDNSTPVCVFMSFAIKIACRWTQPCISDISMTSQDYASRCENLGRFYTVYCYRTDSQA